MKCARLNKWHVCCNERNKLSKLYMNGGYKGNRYPLMLASLTNLKKRVSTYWRHVNTVLLEHIKYKIQL